MKKKILIVLIIDILLIFGTVIVYNPFLKLSLIGEQNVQVEYGNEYTDPGINASYFKESLVEQVTISSNVDLSKVGSYEIKYTLKKGLAVRTVKRKINVIDSISPTLSLTGSSTVHLCGNEYEESGYLAIDNVDGDITNKVVIKKEQGKIIYSVRDTSANETTITRILLEKDEIKPELSLNGSSLLTLKKGTTYKKYGVNATDNCTNNLNDKVKIENNVNINVPGTYEVIYTVIDDNSNEGEIKRTVKVFEFDDMNAGYNEIVEGPTYINGILIVNKKYSIPTDFKADDTASKAALKELQNAAKKEGHSLPLKSGYRSYNTQKDLYNRYLNNRGKVFADGRAARAGHSEHQTGLAFDVGIVSESFGSTATGKWLENNCYKFGFIIRYPKYKELITGYNYEPWHIRYVGIEVATQIMENNLTLEEYLGVYK